MTLQRFELSRLCKVSWVIRGREPTPSISRSDLLLPPPRPPPQNDYHFICRGTQKEPLKLKNVSYSDKINLIPARPSE